MKKMVQGLFSMAGFAWWLTTNYRPGLNGHCILCTSFCHPFSLPCSPRSSRVSVAIGDLVDVSYRYAIIQATRAACCDHSSVGWRTEHHWRWFRSPLKKQREYCMLAGYCASWQWHVQLMLLTGAGCYLRPPGGQCVYWPPVSVGSNPRRLKDGLGDVASVA